MDAQTPLSAYEQAQIEKIRAWRHQPPGVVEQAAGFVLRPLSKLIATIVPASAIETLLRASDWLAERAVRTKVDDEAPLELRDEEAASVRNWAIAYACGEGAVAGAVGLASLPVDIPALVTLSLRTIRRVGIAYGYDGSSEEEKRFVYAILSVAGANSMRQKQAGLETLHGIETTLLAESWAGLADRAAQRIVRAETVLLLIRDVAEQLGVNLTRRKALAAVPVLGAAIGAAMNGWYLRDVAAAAQNAYQERWLRDRGRIQD